MGKSKLPRRTMSMAKKASATADAAADLDLVEGIIGNPEADGQTPSLTRLLLGWAIGMASILALMGACAVLPFTEADTDYSMLPDGYREATGLADAKIGRQSDGSVRQADGSIRADDFAVSPFPEAQTRDPVILEVDCPDGTVRIATGSGPADTVCVRGQLASADPPPSEPTTDIIVVSPATGDTSTIAGTLVPANLDCAEDEVIAFVDVDTLACVHYENVDTDEQ